MPRRRRLHLYGVVLASLFVGCSTRPAVPLAAASGMDAVALRTDSVVRRWMRDGHLPGVALAVVRDGRVLLARGYGVADAAQGTPVTPATRFQIASISKALTAVAIMQRVEAGRLALDDPIGRHLPGLPVAWRAATLRNLLGHTAGIASISEFDRPPCDVGKPEAAYAPGDVLREVDCLPLRFTPGERWSYGDTGYYLLGRLLARSEGGSYEDAMRRTVFGPAGMTTAAVQRQPPLAEIATGYRWTGERYEPAPPFNPMVDEGNGAIVASVLDLARWDAALDASTLLRAATRDTMWTPVPVRSGTSSYGLGFGLTPHAGRRRVGHTGGTMGCATAFSKFPDDRLTVILLANGELPMGQVQRFANEVADGYLGAAPR